MHEVLCMVEWRTLSSCRHNKGHELDLRAAKGEIERWLHVLVNVAVRLLVPSTERVILHALRSTELGKVVRGVVNAAAHA